MIRWPDVRLEPVSFEIPQVSLVLPVQAKNNAACDGRSDYYEQVINFHVLII